MENSMRFSSHYSPYMFSIFNDRVKTLTNSNS
uniref:Uncharacterized protein n=1 Tax=Myoviridae sp. ctTRu92 TaxID=2825111 RepID=A0A8S5Q746_9CAUD|nr:MAG TPA: hypothetical protein [Myoviridae sp. ctTRu92]